MTRLTHRSYSLDTALIESACDPMCPDMSRFPSSAAGTQSSTGEAFESTRPSPWEGSSASQLSRLNRPALVGSEYAASPWANGTRRSQHRALDHHLRGLQCLLPRHRGDVGTHEGPRVQAHLVRIPEMVQHAELVVLCAVEVNGGDHDASLARGARALRSSGRAHELRQKRMTWTGDAARAMLSWQFCANYLSRASAQHSEAS